MSETEFLSARVPRETKRRIKEIAARKGTSVQALIGRLAEELVAREGGAGPALPEVISRLRKAKRRLRSRGILHLHVFGSVARGTAGPESDVDLLADLDPKHRLSLTGLVSLSAELEDVLGYGVDLLTRGTVKPEALEEIEREVVRAF